MAKNTYSQAEKSGLVAYINSKLSLKIDDKDDAIFENIKSGVLLCKLLNAIKPSTVPADKIKETPSSPAEMNQNHEQMLDGLKSFGANIANIPPSELTAGTKPVVLGVVWQIVRYGLFKHISDVSVSTLKLDAALPPEQVLLMWLNYHTKESGKKIVVTNFGEDLADGTVLTQVLHHVGAASGCDNSALSIEDKLAKAEAILKNAEKIGCRSFVEAKDIADGNSRLLLAFVATVFSKFPEMGAQQEAMQWEKQYQELAALLDALTNEWNNKEASLKQSIANATNEKEQIQTDINNIVSKSTTTKQEIEQAKDKKEMTKKKLTDTETNLTQKTAEKNDFTAKLAESNKKKAELNKKIKESAAVNADLEAEGAELKTKISESKTEGEKLKKENEQIKKDIEVALQQITDLQKVKQTLEDEKDKLTKAKKKLNKEKKETTETLTQVNGKIKVQEEMINVLNDTVKELKGQLEAEKQKSEKLTQENKERAALIAKLKARIAELEAELEAAKQRIKELEKQLAMHLKLMDTKRKEGWLQKLSPSGNKRLQKRWFVLKGITLSYFKNDKESHQSKPLGSIDVSRTRVYQLTEEECKKKAGAQNAFEINFLDRGYILVAPNDQERKDWIEAISKAKVHATVAENIVMQTDATGFDADDDD